MYVHSADIRPGSMNAGQAAAALPGARAHVLERYHQSARDNMILIDYQGKFGNQKITEQQRAILEKQHVRPDIIEKLSRKEAFEIIQKGITRWLQEREHAATKRKHWQSHLNRS